MTTRAGRSPGTRRRSSIRWALFAAFVVVPLLEIYVLIQVGQVIGPWWTILLLVLDSVLGAWLVKREGARAWRALQGAIGTGRMPGRELADAALVLVGGTLMLTPGFVTDALALFLVLPFTRPFARRLLAAVVSRRVLAGVPGMAGGDVTRPGHRAGGGSVVRGEVIDE